MSGIDGKLGPIRKGLLEFLILKIVSADRVYVADILKTLSDTEFATQEGTLYPLLSKMRRENLVDYDWKESGSGPPRKYYRLTDAGHNAIRIIDNLAIDLHLKASGINVDKAEVDKRINEMRAELKKNNKDFDKFLAEFA